MKKITLLLILISFSVNAQKQTDSVLRITDSDYYNYGSVYFGKSITSVRVSEDGEVSIHGDTLTAIKLLIDKIDQLQKVNNEKTDCIRRAVDFENTVPDYLTNNKEYRMYLAAIKRQGYTSSVVKIKPVKPVKKRKPIVRDIKIKTS